jgi:hypothetical protein
MAYVRHYQNHVTKVAFKNDDHLVDGVVTAFTFADLARLMHQIGIGEVRGFVVTDDGIKVFHDGSILRPSN